LILRPGCALLKPTHSTEGKHARHRLRPDLVDAFRIGERLGTLHLLAGGHDLCSREKGNLDLPGILDKVNEIRTEVEAIVISSYFRPLNPEHENRTYQTISCIRDLPIVLGPKLSTGLGSPERATTLALNASPLARDSHGGWRSRRPRLPGWAGLTLRSSGVTIVLRWARGVENMMNAKLNPMRILVGCIALCAVLSLALGAAAEARDAAVAPMTRAGTSPTEFGVGGVAAVNTGRQADQDFVALQDTARPGIIVAPTLLTISEPDGSDEFNIRLNSEPNYAVRVPLSTTNQQCNLSTTEVLLDSANWTDGVDVTVVAVDDSVADGDQVCRVLVGPATSNDPVYNNRRGDDVIVIVKDDDDLAEITVSPTTLTISEPNASAMFTVTLTTQPVLSVTVPVTVTSSQCSVSPSAALLDEENWNRGAGITVTASDDCVVTNGPAISGDPRYNGRTGDDVLVIVEGTTRASVYLPQMFLAWPPLPGIPALQPIGNSDGDGTYTITWTPAPQAETYILEQARDSTFATAGAIYNGPSTSHAVAGQMTGRHYYRVKARNGWGDSAWSATQSTDVLWELEPNDQASDANGALVSGLTYLGRFPSREDGNDYYYFDLPAAGRVELWLRNIPSGEDYNLVLRDVNLEPPVGYSGNRGSANEYILNDNLAAGRYYVQVWNYVGNGSTQPYQLQVIY
jgi:hypothetical protein